MSAQAQVLHSALEVRSLSFEAAEAGRPVDVTGVVIFADPPSTVFIQDETAGTFFRLGNARPPKPGDEVHVTGISHTGLYLPGIEDSTFQVLRHVGLPEAIPATFDDLMSGRYHYQRVAIEGVVRTLSLEGESTTIARVSLGSRVVEVKVEQPLPEALDLVDSRVRVAGLAAGHINARRQLVAPYLRCRDWNEFTILTPCPGEENIPSVSSAQLMNFDVEGQGGHLVRLSGTVLAVFSRDELFLRDENAGIGVKLLQPDPNVRVGDRLEVVGFPEMERFSAFVVDAAITAIEPGETEPEPVEVAFADLMEGTEDGNLVSVVGVLTDKYRSGAGGVLVLQEGKGTLQARTPELPEGLPAGAQVRVTGICQVETTRGQEYRSQPESVSLRLRTAADIQVLRAPSWWTAERLAFVLAAALVAILLAGLWIALLRRQVSRQTVALRHRIEHEATLEERQRIAREFHDTLEQELAGLSLRLDAAVAKGGEDKLMGLLSGSRSLVGRIQTETRNLVSDLRDTTGENTNLEAALKDLAAGHPEGLGPEIRYETPPGDNGLPRLAPRTVHHLKMIARESIANALKHAQANHVTLRAGSENGALILTITDDGQGFDVANDTRGKSGHFGCMGIRERCLKLGASVEWHSEPGKGTTVEVRLSLKEENKAIG